MYDSVLVPTDGSQQMAVVVDQAVELASMCEATLHALHVVDERAYYSVPDDARERVRETLAADAESFTEAVADRAEAVGLQVLREVRWGDPAPGILSYAVENRIGCVVMGTHGRTGYEWFLLGSVAEKVVRMAPMPVLAVAVGDTDELHEEILATASTEPGPAEGTPRDLEDPAALSGDPANPDSTDENARSDRFD